MASGEGDDVRDGVRVGVRVGEARVHVRDGDGVRVRDGVRDGVGMDSDAGRHGSATPPVEKDGGTVV
jgi:hypothetical protein